MSGGVDPSVAACLMKQDGYDYMGVTMKLYHNEDIGVSKAHTCCSLNDIEDARSVAFQLVRRHQRTLGHLQGLRGIVFAAGYRAGHDCA